MNDNTFFDKVKKFLDKEKIKYTVGTTTYINRKTRDTHFIEDTFFIDFENTTEKTRKILIDDGFKLEYKNEGKDKFFYLIIKRWKC